MPVAEGDSLLPHLKDPSNDRFFFKVVKTTFQAAVERLQIFPTASKMIVEDFVASPMISKLVWLDVVLGAAD